MNISSKSLSHLGLVSGTFDELGIADLIDSSMPKSRNHHLSHSTVVKAMCLNGLGFNESRLYLYSGDFENLPTERLLGEGILPKHINDDVLGRTLDKIYEYGCTELFNQIVLKTMKNVPFGNHILHTDTTNFSLHGNYKNRDPELNTIKITYGHPKAMLKNNIAASSALVPNFIFIQFHLSCYISHGGKIRQSLSIVKIYLIMPSGKYWGSAVCSKFS